MDINKMKSNLKMNNLYFSSCSVERTCKVENGDLTADLSRKINSTGNHEYDVELTLSITKDDLKVFVITKAHFIYEAEDNDTNLEESIIKTNTVAIMFPFIRSQVTLLTTQPNMTPIVLPPINISLME
jgi:preprotein translocase subunit SecB